MSWLSDIAGKAENLLTNLDEQTGAAIRNVSKQKKFIRNNINDISIRPKRPTSKAPTKNVYNRSESPPKRLSPPPRTVVNSLRSTDYAKDFPTRLRRSPTRKSTFDLNPNSIIAEAIEEENVIDNLGINHRRYSLPDDIGNSFAVEKYVYKLQKLEVENGMLKNELNVMNKEVSQLLDRLHSTEDGLSKAQKKVQSSEELNTTLNNENSTMQKQINQLKQKIEDLINLEVVKFKENNAVLVRDLENLREVNKELEEKVKTFETQNKRANTKLENDLRHAQNYVNDLQTDLEKSKSECHRLEREWEAYKLRVKSMLNTKDKELQAIQHGQHYAADTKLLLDQIQNLREERESLAEEVERVRIESGDTKQQIEQLEARSQSAERLIVALREALREERLAKNKADADCLMVKKELKHLQSETSHNLANLHSLLLEKDAEISKLKELTSTSGNSTSDSSGLNVADYDVMHETIANDKVQYLTQTLIAKQGKIESLLADNNMLRIQLEKLDNKFKKELAVLRANNHSVVSVNDAEGRIRERNRYIPQTLPSRMTLSLVLFLRRNPLCRLLIIVYMVGLHLWVALVLLTYTPEGQGVAVNSRI